MFPFLFLFPRPASAGKAIPQPSIQRLLTAPLVSPHSALKEKYSMSIPLLMFFFKTPVDPEEQVAAKFDV